MVDRKYNAASKSENENREATIFFIQQLQKENEELKREIVELNRENQEIEELKREIEELKRENQEIEELKRENEELKRENQEIEELKRENAQQKEQIESLREQLNKDSHNSSKPPSSDGFKKKTRSLRKPSGKKPGGQEGHAGHTLELVEDPDKIIVHEVCKCEKCGYPLDSEEIYNVESHQVFDLPELNIEINGYEHQAEMKKCPKCGVINKADFPAHASNIVQYGDRINGLASYLSNYQLIPLERVKEFFFDLFNQPICKASLIKMNKTTYQALESFDDTIKEKLINASVLNVDESGFYCENKRQWLHGASTKTMTYYQFHEKRGNAATDEIGILPYFKGVLVHDHWKPYFKYSCAHALCNTHHLRELIFLIEEKKRQWAWDMRSLLLEIKETVETVEAEKIKPNGECLDVKVINEFENRYDEIIEKGRKEEPPTPSPPPHDHPDLPKKRGPKKKSKSLNLLERLKNHKEKVLVFMYNRDVPFDNNLAERDIRMMKVQQKISGAFRTRQGAMYFCRIRSYISTAKKNDKNVLSVIGNAIRGQPFIPK